MISDVKRAKFTHYFHVTDTSGDGLITKHDYLLAADRVVEVLKMDPESQPAQMLKAGYARYWDAIAIADTDGDDAVSLEEWIEHFWF